MKKTLLALSIIIVITALAFGQATFRAPTISGVGTSTVKWTAGTIYNGGHSVTVAANLTGTAVDASMTDCTAPSFGACDIMYANSSGTVAITQTLATAAASGDTILAYIETTAGGLISTIALPLQSGTLWTNSGGFAGSSTVSTFTPYVVNTVDIGSALLPFRKIYAGTAATNNFVFTPSATSAARIITIPDPGGAATMAFTNSTTAQPMTGLGTISSLTAGTYDFGTAALPWFHLYLGTAATNNFVFTPAATGAARVITIADPGGAATLAYTNSTTVQALTGLGAITSLTAGTYDIGSTALPWANLWLGTAATNNWKLTASSTSAARILTIPDYGADQHMPGTVYLTGSDYTNATTGFTSITGLAFPIAASQNYHATAKIYWSTGTNTCGPKYQFTGVAAPTAVEVGMWSTVTATTMMTATAAAFSNGVANTGTVTTGTIWVDTVDINILNGANAGTVQLQAACNGAGTLTVKVGSSLIIQ